MANLQDLAIYCKAKLITWKYPEEFTNTVIHLGGFHVALNFLSVIGKRYQSSGIEDVMIESGAYGSGTVTSLMKGKSYNRGIRAHKLMMEALFRLMWQAFIQWLNADDHQAYKLQAKEKEEEVAESMKSINLAIKSKSHIAQKADIARNKLETVMEIFEIFRKEEKARSQMFAFWDEYIRMVIMLLQFVKAERTRNWHLHLQSASTMIRYFFAHDRQNYSRWLPVYVADMQQLAQKHKEVYQEYVDGQHAISRSSQPFASVWTDMALEQSVNLDSKSKGGIIGISQNEEALQRWFLTCHERASLTTAVKRMCRIGDSDRVGSHVHKEGAQGRTERGSQRVVILSPDTDVLVLCITHFHEIGCQQLWFRTGVKDRLRYIPAHKIATYLGPEICQVLPAFHALTGCDSTSALFRIGKKKAWNGMTAKNNQAHLLSQIGQSPSIDEEIASKAESFICSLYGTAKKTPKTSDEARYLLFCQKTKNNLMLPPTSDSLKQHISRANFQAYVWRRALVAMQDLPSPVGYGWKLEDDELYPVLMTKPAAPSSILELTNCKCSSTSKSNCSKNCSCSNNGLACTEACLCMADDSCSNPNKPSIYDSDEDDENDEDDEDDLP